MRGEKNKELILVVDNDREIGGVIVGQILPGLGYRSEQAFDGLGALTEITKQQPAILLLDLDLPDINGLELLRRLKSNGFVIPTIIFAEHDSAQISIEAFQLGVVDYIIKPVETHQLAKTIDRALEETRLRVERTRLLAELNEQVSWLLSLSKIGQSVTSTLDLDEVLRRIVEAAVTLTQADEGFLALLDHSTGTLFLRASQNIDGQITSSLRLPIADSLLGETLTSGKPMRQSTHQPGQTIKIGTGLLVHSLMNVPILSRGRPLGVLSVDNRKKPRDFSSREEVILTALADYAAVALENASLYQQARYEIVERKRIESALRESEERYALAARGANDGIWDLDISKNKLYLSPRWKIMLGYQEHEIDGDPNEWFNRVHPDDISSLKESLTALISCKTSHLEMEYRILDHKSNYRWMLCRGVAVQGLDGGVLRVAGSQTDISERKTFEARLLYNALHDNLTKLPNRALIIDHLHKAILRAEQEPGYTFGVLFLDLDQFKKINDSHGHPAGDQLLIAVAKKLKNTLRLSDTIARIGGDEFVVLLDGIRDEKDAVDKAREIIAELEQPVKFGAHECIVTTSIGIVLSTLGYQRPEDVLRDADIAMYIAKSHGRSRLQVFNPQMRQEIMHRLALEVDIKQALAGNQFVVHYQPIIKLSNGELVGFEALIHWQHPQRGLISADQFLSIAQETGQILQIDWWVLEKACSQLQSWIEQCALSIPLSISVNLGNSMLMNTLLISEIQAKIRETGLPPNRLVLEIAESFIMHDVDETPQVISSLKEIGIGVQIDDFGIGLSSLLHLNDLQIDAIKIDRSFIRRINSDGKFTEIPRMMIALAHNLEIKTTAEGVENLDQLEFLRSLDCDFGQGYLFSNPLGVNAAGQLLESFHKNGTNGLPWGHLWQN